jgi:hypothetical protein
MSRQRWLANRNELVEQYSKQGLDFADLDLPAFNREQNAVLPYTTTFAEYEDWWESMCIRPRYYQEVPKYSHPKDKISRQRLLSLSEIEREEFRQHGLQMVRALQAEWDAERAEWGAKRAL